ncbi:MAG: hypothetical protein ACYC7B_10120 [Burkholderiales bacterium]
MSGVKQASAGAREYIGLRLSILRGRCPVRADRRLRANEKRIRAQSTISYKEPPQTVAAFIHNRVFCADALFIRTENTVGARSAQVFVAHTGV